MPSGCSGFDMEINRKLAELEIRSILRLFEMNFVWYNEC